jgi:flagellin
MSFGVLNSTANSANLAFEHLQSKLFDATNSASTGKRINTAADDPSGLAIATNLATQAESYNAASGNVNEAQNAATVADGALQSTQDSLQALSSIAVQATNDLLSPSDRADLQTVANQLVQQINTNAQTAGFNGTQLLTGSFAGPTPATPANATVTNNAQLSGGGTLVQNVTASPNAQSGTIALSVVSGSNGPAVQATFTNSQTGATTTATSTATPGSTITVNGTTITLGNFGAADETATSTVQVAAARAAGTAATLNVQSAANEGAVTGVNSPNGTSQGLLISNIDLSSSAAATNAQGQINGAIQQLAQARATLGAEVVSLGEQQTNNDTAATNLTASAASITDQPASTSASELNLLRIQGQISLTTLQNANNLFGYLNRFVNAGA